ncbi:hypothetical protein ACO0LB_19870 [Undibacterium sp. SXout7W]|uniref:hypothetical protein n=1 Tax=Undibacterium sp. SXout7W TaxID=3413049 RepID=UPI003BF154A2
MDSLTLSIFLMGAAPTLLAIIFIYNAAVWNWKTKPLIPLSLGLATLILGFAADLYLATKPAEIKQMLDSPKLVLSAEQIKLFKSNVDANDGLAKLLEFVTIPLAVSLIAAAVFAKADSQFIRRLEQYKKACEKLFNLETELTKAEKEFEQRIINGDRGKDFLDHLERLQKFRLHVIFARSDLRREFKDILE